MHEGYDFGVKSDPLHHHGHLAGGPGVNAGFDICTDTDVVVIVLASA